MKPESSDRSSESGNIFIYIIGAIFLMGILVVLLKGSNTPGAGIDAEQLEIRVTEVQRYGSELEQAVRLIMQNGHSESDIRFAHPNADSAYGDISTDTPLTRQVFSPEGGAAEYRDPPDGINDGTPWFFSGRNVVGQIGTSCSTDDCVDLVAILPNVTKDFCVALNEADNVTNPSGNPPMDDSTAELVTPFAGTFSYANWILDTSNDLATHSEGCFEGGGTPANGTYHYYRVLMAR